VVDFTMRFELGFEKPDPRRALTSGLTIGSAYVAGGLIPLAPYMTLATIPVALMASVAVTALALGLSAESRHALQKQPRSAVPSRRC
jgi:vacuolar iron transporter family protein